jgi:hypothetical protein
MFSLSLKNRGENKMVYGTSIGFRLVFAVIALLILAAVVSVSDGSISIRPNVIALILLVACLYACVFLEQWVFDREADTFEKNVGLIFLYGTKKGSLQSLSKVVLDVYLKSGGGKTKTGSIVSRKPVTLLLKDREDKIYKVDIARGIGVEELRRTAKRLSEFCEIPLEDNSRDPDRETTPDNN